MRRAAKIDDNQKEIVACLEKLGFKVKSLAAVGDGFPDLCAARAGANYLIEVKDGNKIPSQQKLTKAQVEFFKTWPGQKVVLNSVNAVLAWEKGL